MYSLSCLDTNNHLKNAAVGEREGRIYSSLIGQRYYGLGHGVGRSGDLCEPQPKAAGSSVLYQLTNKLALNALKLSGLSGLARCLVLPMATGMSLSLCMRALSKRRGNAKYVVWTRVDQKSCFKAILSAGFIPIVVQNRIVGDEITTDVQDIEAAITSMGPEKVVCMVTTTSCFAPRAPDDLLAVGKVCCKYDIPHLVNNAYGVQVAKYCGIITEAIKRSRVDLVVQSTDKNFMVPVGGSVVASPHPDLLVLVSNTYAGRASVSPSIDMFVTLLEMGSNEYKRLLEARTQHFVEMEAIVASIVHDFRLRALSTPQNRISLALSLGELRHIDTSQVGRKLFFRSVSGCRVVRLGVRKEIEGYVFENWGSHVNNYPCDYLTCAASIGMKEDDLIAFDKRLRSVLSEAHKPENG